MATITLIDLAMAAATLAGENEEVWYGIGDEHDQVVFAAGVWTVGSNGDIDDFATEACAVQALAESWTHARIDPQMAELQ